MFSHRFIRSFLTAAGMTVVACFASVWAEEPGAGPADLALTFASPFDGSEQPYRLYLPSAHDGTRPVPLLVALHGTGGDQNKYFDHAAYGDGIYKHEAEKRGLAVLCPLGNDALGRPTEWRGVGELHVLAAIEDVQRRFCVDPDRIVLTGQSMGGTGTTYLCCRYPDVFAAGIPLASTYGHVTLVANLRHVPMLFVHGAKDWPIYAKTGPIPLSEEMARLGYDGTLWMIPEAGHNTMDVSTERVLDWALQQRRVAHPRHVTHRAYFPPHGRAWWVDIQEFERIGWFAEVDASIDEGNRIRIGFKNASRVVLRPEPDLLDLSAPVVVLIDGEPVFNATCASEQEILLTKAAEGWTAGVQPRHLATRTEPRSLLIGTVEQAPDWSGEIEATLGNWLADAMRDISGADVAICNKGHFRYGKHFRGAPIQAGQDVFLIDLVNWLRPCDAALATFTVRGSELLDIIEDNIRDKPQENRFLIQVSGCRYRFDRRLAQGKRVVASDIEPDREYKVVCNSSAITRTDTMYLAGRFDRLGHEVLEPNVLSAAWHYIANNGGRITARLEGRVEEVK
ncbi:MAG: 5'-nucleotidase C-terminal domain-containing protein [Thermoguttaceae bacterium]|jgi:poly(3-hydroxybutyrate) depolymerase|nr:5'-nucleotidase C-terminal domain-containing protein [Thermoguttaceae bacterium]